MNFFQKTNKITYIQKDL